MHLVDNDYISLLIQFIAEKNLLIIMRKINMKKYLVILTLVLSSSFITACNSGSSSSSTTITSTLNLTATPQTCDLSNNSTITFNLSGLTPGVSYEYYTSADDYSYLYIDTTMFMASASTQTTTLSCNQISTNGQAGTYYVRVWKEVDPFVYSNSIAINVIQGGVGSL